MIRELTCIECPQGCRLRVEQHQDGYVISLTGNRCERGRRYAEQEVTDPRRTLTTTVRALGLDLGFVPVRTSAPIPKTRLAEAMTAVRALRLDHPVEPGDVVVPNFLGTGADLVAARRAVRESGSDSTTSGSVG